MDAQDLKNQIIEKAWSDPSFKKDLLSNPKATIKDVFGVEAPEEINLHILEETANDLYLVLPQNPSDISSDEDVEGARWL
ncbi:NHLP leader peptide family natural product precursor [Paenibacillus agaridevorans]|uniref:NHLP leader peptide family natural product n=1 Tax=Paenibacillus agaridevorans TaxID=171404 RepID=A0A2R5EWE9_9BACL|nr:NHLP leader peptide family RiPP precursor [Paenibacillus agaridevorans]GBG10877.1 NHLP leader peptide family natural product precursor [Paenibacillus agaridevorans]